MGKQDVKTHLGRGPSLGRKNHKPEVTGVGVACKHLVWNKLNKKQLPTPVKHSVRIPGCFFKTSVRAKLSPISPKASSPATEVPCSCSRSTRVWVSAALWLPASRINVTRTMAAASGLNQNATVRIWRAFGLKPHLQENFKLSTDPLFVEKVRDIVGLYLNPT